MQNADGADMKDKLILKGIYFNERQREGFVNEIIKKLNFEHKGFRVRRDSWLKEIDALVLYVGTNKVFLQFYKNGKEIEEKAVSNEIKNKNWILR